MSDNLDFLDGDAPAEPTVVRDEKGRFAASSQPEPATPEPTPEPVAAQPEPEPQPEAQPAPPVQAQPEPQKPPPGYVPLSALKELREEIKALKAVPREPPPPPPDRYEDPDGYEAYQHSQISNAMLNQNLNYSERFARKEHGQETVDQAREWALARFEQDPLYQQAVLTDPDPYEKVVSDWRRDQVFTQLGDGDLAAFLAWKNGQAQQAPAAQPAAVPPTPTPPRSLASAPAAGGGKPGEQPVGPGVAFDSIF